ncbi:Uncharacterised protein [Mycobacterium tuberculosis]|nr:Uncharacterised protein [Mycobacterium tuberculosis]
MTVFPQGLLCGLGATDRSPHPDTLHDEFGIVVFVRLALGVQPPVDQLMQQGLQHLFFAHPSIGRTTEPDALEGKGDDTHPSFPVPVDQFNLAIEGDTPMFQ